LFALEELQLQGIAIFMILREAFLLLIIVTG